MGDGWKRLAFLQDILLVTVGPVMMYFLIRRILSRNETTTRNPELSERLQNILKERDEQEDEFYDSEEDYGDANGSSRSSRPPPRPKAKQSLELSTYEQSIAGEVVHPSEIPISFQDIGGLDDLISDLQESVIYPLTMPHLYQHSSPLLSAPSGVLLYGPPGCGKTMLAKALAHESGAVFINLHISTLTEKWYGDSNKLVAAVFSLARKLQPSIVFIDEIDAVLGTRRRDDHEASSQAKAEFMTHWDGLVSSNSGTKVPQRIMILGATNRPHDIDEAILRRMPKKFAVGLPDAEQRRRIFKLILKDTKVDQGVGEEGQGILFDIDLLVKTSAGMSGSDIKEACREAAMEPVREYIRRNRSSGKSIRSIRPQEVRGLRTADFFSSQLGNGGLQSRSAGPRKAAADAATRQAEEVDDYETTDDEENTEMQDAEDHPHEREPATAA